MKQVSIEMPQICCGTLESYVSLLVDFDVLEDS